MEEPHKLLLAKPAKLPNRACSAGRSLYSPSMSYVLGFQTKYIWNAWGILFHPAQSVLLYLSTLLDSWLAHFGNQLALHWVTVSYLLFDRGSSEAAVLVEISRDFSSFSMVHFFSFSMVHFLNQAIIHDNHKIINPLANLATLDTSHPSQPSHPSHLNSPSHPDPPATSAPQPS